MNNNQKIRDNDEENNFKTKDIKKIKNFLLPSLACVIFQRLGKKRK